MSTGRHRIADSIFLLTIGVLLAWSLIIAIVSTTVFEMNYVQHLLKIFLIILFGRLLCIHRMVLWAAFALFILFAGVLLFGFFTDTEGASALHHAIGVLERTVQFVLGYVEYDPVYERVILWVIHILIGLAVLVFGFVDKHILLLLAVFAGAFAGLLFTPVFTHVRSFYLFVFCMTAYLLYDLNTELAVGKKRRPFYFGALIITTCSMLLASFIPTVSDELQETLRRPMDAINNALLDTQSMDEFAISYIGFGEESGRLGGDLQVNDSIFMFVQTERPTPFYLTGAVYDYYTGYSWLVSDSDDLRPFLPRDALGAMIDGTLPPLQQMHINNVHRTSTVFWRGIVQMVLSVEDELQFVERENGQIRTVEPMPQGVWYTIVYVQMPRFSEWQHSGEAMPEAWFFERYTALPVGFSNRVAMRAAEVTAEATSDYERARMLEQYLSTNYAYTLTPGSLPEGLDFVDHFLFEIQAGYCVHFATAFVTMARSLGMMARYVEGFLVSGLPNNLGYLEVRNDLGHAWAEVYFPGYGWHLFEPTPAASFGGTDVREAPFVPDMPPEPQVTPTVPYEAEPEYTGEAEQEEIIFPDDEYGDAEGNGTSETENEIAEQRAGMSYLGMALLIVFALVLLLALRVVYLAFLRKKSGGFGSGAQVEQEFWRVLRYMECLGLGLQTDETREDFIARVEELTYLAEVFVRARYSEHLITKEEYSDVKQAVDMLEIRLKTEIGRVRYTLQKHVFGKI